MADKHPINFGSPFAGTRKQPKGPRPMAFGPQKIGQNRKDENSELALSSVDSLVQELKRVVVGEQNGLKESVASTELQQNHADSYLLKTFADGGRAVLARNSELPKPMRPQPVKVVTDSQGIRLMAHGLSPFRLGTESIAEGGFGSVRLIGQQSASETRLWVVKTQKLPAPTDLHLNHRLREAPSLHPNRREKRDTLAQMVKNEVALMVLAQSPLAPQFLFHDDSMSSWHMVMPLMAGDLRHFSNHLPLEDVRRQDLGFEVVRQLLPQLGRLHEQNIFLRDIKPDNILVDFTGKLFFSDFGLATRSQQGTGAVGTSLYRAPEIEEHLKKLSNQTAHGATDSFNLKYADLWSLGVTLMETLTNNNPFSPRNSTFQGLADVMSANIVRQFLFGRWKSNEIEREDWLKRHHFALSLPKIGDVFTQEVLDSLQWLPSCHEALNVSLSLLRTNPHERLQGFLVDSIYRQSPPVSMEKHNALKTVAGLVQTEKSPVLTQLKADPLLAEEGHRSADRRLDISKETKDPFERAPNPKGFAIESSEEVVPKMTAAKFRAKIRVGIKVS